MMTVGVLVTAYRRRRWLPAALASLRAQTRRPDEIVLVKDAAGPEDDDWRDAGARVLVKDEPSVGAMLADGLRSMTSDVVCFLDDDDEFDSAKVAWVRAAFGMSCNLTWLRHGFNPIDENSLPARDALSQPERPVTLFFDDAVGVRRLARRRGYGVLSCAAVRRSSIDLEALSRVDAVTDAAMLSLAANHPGWAFVSPRRLTRRRVHVSQRSVGLTGEALRAWRTARELQAVAVTPLSREVARITRCWAEVEWSLLGGRFPRLRWALAEYAALRADRPKAFLETLAFGLLTALAPAAGQAAYARRRGAWR